MADDDPTLTDTGDTPPAKIPETSEPQWAKDLKTRMDELPGKLRATLSDDDRASIAESVHGLFDKSGAFLKDEPKQEDPPAEEETETEEGTPHKRSGIGGFASRFLNG